MKTTLKACTYDIPFGRTTHARFSLVQSCPVWGFALLVNLNRELLAKKSSSFSGDCASKCESQGVQGGFELTECSCRRSIVPHVRPSSRHWRVYLRLKMWCRLVWTFGQERRILVEFIALQWDLRLLELQIYHFCTEIMYSPFFIPMSPFPIYVSIHM